MGVGPILGRGRWISQKEMIEAVRDEDIEVLHLFYQDTARPVYNFILSLIRSPEEAESVMQDTYLTVWTKVGSCVPQGKPLAWVFTIARSLCYMWFREQKMKTDVTLEDLTEDGEEEYCTPSEQAVDRKVLLDALGQASHEEHQIVLLHAVTGMKHQEMAETLQVPLVTILSRYNRSMKKLQELFRCSR